MCFLKKEDATITTTVNDTEQSKCRPPCRSSLNDAARPVVLPNRIVRFLGASEKSHYRRESEVDGFDLSRPGKLDMTPYV